jgi:Na+-driven multidrug efflux pump
MHLYSHHFINGVGKLNISLITATVNSVINIPLSVLFAKYMGLGINGVILGTCISLSIGAVLRPLQSYKIMNNKAYGVWIE